MKFFNYTFTILLLSALPSVSLALIPKNKEAIKILNEFINNHEAVDMILDGRSGLFSNRCRVIVRASNRGFNIYLHAPGWMDNSATISVAVDGPIDNVSTVLVTALTQSGNELKISTASRTIYGVESRDTLQLTKNLAGKIVTVSIGEITCRF